MHITNAKPDDAVTLTEIAFAAKRQWGYPEKWIQGWREVLTVLPEFIAGHETYAAIDEGRTVGFYVLGRKGERMELLHLWVLPDAMCRGVGRSLFAHALERMKSLGFRELEIESDPNAEGFYKRMGARRVGTSTKDVVGQRHRSDVMNPFGIVQAIITLLEGVAARRQKESKSEQRRFLLFYFVFLLLGIAVLVWVVRSLYFTK